MEATKKHDIRQPKHDRSVSERLRILCAMCQCSAATSFRRQEPNNRQLLSLQNPTFENYCSQCFRERKSTNLIPNDKVDATTIAQVTGQPLLVSTQVIEAAPYRSLTPTTITPVLSPAPLLSPSPTGTPHIVPAESSLPVPSPELLTSTTPESNTSTPEENEPDAPPRIVQTTKSRCFMCRAKIPLANQITNQCRCEYVFCTTHKHPDQHNCDYEYKSEGRATLAKNNPKLKENKGGRSFNRII